MRIRVLLIDEDDDDRASLAERLRRVEGLELIAAVADGHKAALSGRDRRPDIVLVNLHRRDSGELELCRALSKSGLVPIVALVSYVTAEGARALMNAGVATWLLKHVDSRMLGQGIRRAFEEHRHQTA